MKKYSKKILKYVAQRTEQEIKQLDFGHFLETTKYLKIVPSERLRQLAIFVEQECYFEEEEKWEVLNRIYTSASKQDPNDGVVYHSWGVAANHFVQFSANEALKAKLFKVADWVFAKSEAVGNKDALLYYSWGLLYYFAEGKAKEDAIEKFKQSIALKPKFSKANMYLGYAYFDIEQWKEALAAFSLVGDAALRGHWERIKKQELIACAKIELGQVEEGLKLLEEKVISEYRLGRYRSYDTFSLAEPREMLIVLRKLNQQDLVAEIESLVAS